MSNQLAARKETIDIVTARVREFQNKGELYFPSNYIPENALKSAWLTIQETEDKNKKPALEVCTKESIANALLSMVIQGLNPDKKQCYFIVYGNKLQLQRSYFGSMAVAKSVDADIEDIYGMVVYDGDEFEYEISKGKKIVTKHTQKIQNVKKENIVAAYACTLYKSGKENYVIMTIDEIKQAWKMSKMYPVDDKGNIKGGSTHDKFMAEMCIKTVINRICKPIINSSSDSNIVAKFAAQTDAEFKELDVQEEIEENANKQVIDVSPAQDVEHQDEFDPVEVVEEGPDF